VTPDVPDGSPPIAARHSSMVRRSAYSHSRAEMLELKAQLLADLSLPRCSDASKTEASCTGSWDHDCNAGTPDIARTWLNSSSSGSGSAGVFSRAAVEAIPVRTGVAYFLLSFDTEDSAGVKFGSTSANAPGAKVILLMPQGDDPEAQLEKAGSEAGNTGSGSCANNPLRRYDTAILYPDGGVGSFRFGAGRDNDSSPGAWNPSNASQIVCRGASTNYGAVTDEYSSNCGQCSQLLLAALWASSGMAVAVPDPPRAFTEEGGLAGAASKRRIRPFQSSRAVARDTQHLLWWLRKWFTEDRHGRSSIGLTGAAAPGYSSCADRLQPSWRLFTAGYGEGGYAAVAAHRAIELADPQQLLVEGLESTSARFSRVCLCLCCALASSHFVLPFWIQGEL
jgi:hypothetical protein